MRRIATRVSRRVAARVLRFHRDERGGMLEYLLVLAAFGLPMVALTVTLTKILTDVYAMISFYVGWPFL